MAKRKKGTKRRHRSIRGLNTGDAGAFATQTLLPGILGAIAANHLDKLPFLKDNPRYVNYAGIVLGSVAAIATKQPMLQAAGVGMAIVSSAAVANDLLDGQATNGLGLLYPGQASRGIAGGADDGQNPVKYAL